MKYYLHCNIKLYLLNDHQTLLECNIDVVLQFQQQLWLVSDKIFVDYNRYIYFKFFSLIIEIDTKMNSEQFTKYLEHLDHPFQLHLSPNLHR